MLLERVFRVVPRPISSAESRFGADMRNPTRNRRRPALSAGYGTCVRDLRSLAAAMGFPPMEFRAREISRTLLADLPLDQSDRSVECRFYIHFCSVEQVGVVGPSHWRAVAARIAGVSIADHHQGFLVGYIPV